jgi:chemosensory pili system protein ChpA (sensor histidine kinase/response regulator)
MSGPILIVEDDEDIRDIMAAILEANGYRVLAARSGAEALALAEAEVPALALVDLMMPVMDGAELVGELRKHPNLAAVPVALVSGDLRCRELAAQLGIVGCLAKPVELDDLLALAARIVGPTSLPAV